MRQQPLSLGFAKCKSVILINGFEKKLSIQQCQNAPSLQSTWGFLKAHLEKLVVQGTFGVISISKLKYT